MNILHQKNILEENNFCSFFKTDMLEFPPHWHGEIELIYVVGDCLDVGVNDKVYNLKYRDFLIVLPGEVHYFLPGKNESLRSILQIDLSVFSDLSEVVMKNKIINPLIDEQNIIHSTLESKLICIENEMKTKKMGYKFIIKAMVFEIVISVLRNLEIQPFIQSERIKYLNKLEKLKVVFSFVEKNYYKKITLEEISNTVHFSQYHFTRFFKETTGMTFHKYLNNYRISKALILLDNTNLSITEIAFKTGFESIKTFNRVFKKVKEKNPTKYRKQFLRSN